ncbi:bactofilin family protein [Tsuneonella mangrovi]|uniref:bactofilin family protein n=1 Tax=Tsuneonella mangrovi TaxID=1982042 RepID=UPI00196A8ECA|nr:polymer-forming cytoskeletal protein [Tsuneonella mangrovi]
MAKLPSGGSTFSVIGSDVTIKGDISASADLHLDGRIEGDIACASLVQGESSHVQGAIEAESARIGGTVTGSITARELVVLQTAKIEGDVYYDTLTIEQGATVEGRFAHRVPGKVSTAAPAATPATPKVGGDDEPKLHLAG